ncbi:hypothetical protein HYPSUDRAFT_725277 [Hypholoma sublateritium FD-334 SS-4]|uniref:Uncharacterized protein n=1 Tax=Hypholoma sublateritium (strain FD-334 SS-4) TaxID=945553 RepID=A0A0D2NRY2_HYPSF|nr:hypothetical protein HYPSUDRAFT_725277 [Hypholoma sublateritium FD-334 SS-4]
MLCHVRSQLTVNVQLYETDIPINPALQERSNFRPVQTCTSCACKVNAKYRYFSLHCDLPPSSRGVEASHQEATIGVTPRRSWTSRLHEPIRPCLPPPRALNTDSVERITKHPRDV